MTPRCGFLIDHMSSERSGAALKSERKVFLRLKLYKSLLSRCQTKEQPVLDTRCLHSVGFSSLSFSCLPQPTLPRSVEEDNLLEGTRDLAADQSRKREILQLEVRPCACVEQKRSREQRNEEKRGLNRTTIDHEHTWWKERELPRDVRRRE